MKTASLVLVSLVSASIVACSSDDGADKDAAVADAAFPDDEDAGSAEDAGELDASTDAGELDASIDAGELDASIDAGELDANADADDAGGGDGALDAGSAGDGGTVGGSDAGCAQDTGLTLPPGFCANVFAEQLIAPRHIAVSPAGDVFVALGSQGHSGTSFVALRDADGDGRAEARESRAGAGGNGVFWAAGQLYFAADDAVLRYPAPSGQLVPGAPVTVVSGLPATPDHYAKSVVVASGDLYVNIGSASNACQAQNRVPGSAGVDPCPELATRSGVWKFALDRDGQVQADGVRMVTGSRNLNALALNAQNEHVYAAQNGRDQLYENWPSLYSAADDQRLPAEGVYELFLGDDYGWPYCYFDPTRNYYVLAPEYGGDGVSAGRCSGILRYPLATLPAHWAPLGMVFYEGDAFPARYRHGAFIANHGSRFASEATGELPGYDVVFIPFAGGSPTGPYERFVEGFAGAGRPLPDAATHRPVGVAVGAHGELYVSDDKGGVVYRVTYVGAP